MWHWTITFHSANFLSFRIICGLYTWQLEFYLSHLQMENSAGGWESSWSQVWLCSFLSQRYIRTDSCSDRKVLQEIIFLYTSCRNCTQQTHQQICFQAFMYTIPLEFIFHSATVKRYKSINGLNMPRWFWPSALFYPQCLSSSILCLMCSLHLHWRHLCILCAMVQFRRRSNGADRNGFRRNRYKILRDII